MEPDLGLDAGDGRQVEATGACTDLDRSRTPGWQDGPRVPSAEVSQVDPPPAHPTTAVPSAWERGALLSITAVACLAYAWRINEALLEPYYAASVRSMALGWRNFAYGAFDPDGTITIDKLPGAFWLQAVSVRVFGMHAWAIVLPQVIEGGLTIIVLHRAVRRLAGPAAGLSAAVVLAVSPVNVALDRGNISDTLLTLLLVLAADATSRAVRSGRTSSLVVAGTWVGLAFNAKMLQAWLVLPALGLAVLIAAPGSLRRRIGQVGAAGAVTAIVSLSWMALVALTPAVGRPYVDGSTSDSIFEQVFAYNGFRRLAGWSPLSTLAQLGLGGGMFDAPPAAWNRLLAGPYGRAAGWMLPAALIALVAGIVARRHEPRSDPVRASLVLWGTWLVVFGAAFSATSTGWPYYAAVLSPATGALIGVAFAAALSDRHTPGTASLIIVASVVAISVGYGAWLLPDEGTGLPSRARPVLVGVGIVSELFLVARVIAVRPARWLTSTSMAFAAGAVLLAPAAASVSIVVHRMGPFDTPFQPRPTTESNRSRNDRVPDIRGLEQMRLGAPYLLAAQPGGLASRFILQGQRVVPIGGLSGIIPEPSLARLTSMIARGDFHAVITMPSDDSRYAWIASRCSFRRRLERAELYYCRPGDAESPSRMK